MKKSKVIKFGLFNGLILSVAACGPSYQVAGVDPCNVHTFQSQVCQQAITQHGYFYDGIWINLFYPNPFSYYYAGYNTFVYAGGRVYAAPLAVYDRSYISYDARADRFAGSISANSGTYLSYSRMSSLPSMRSGGTIGRGGFGGIGRGFSSAS